MRGYTKQTETSYHFDKVWSVNPTAVSENVVRDANNYDKGQNSIYFK